MIATLRQTLFSRRRALASPPPAARLGGTAQAAAAPALGAPRSPWVLVAAASAWMATAGNLPLWQTLHGLGALHGVRGAAFGAGLAVGIAALTAALLALVAWGRVLKPAIVLLLLLTALGGHFIHSYHVIIDPGMAVNVLQTDLHEALDLASVDLLAWVLALAVVPAAVVLRWPQRRLSPGRAVLHNLALFGTALAVAVGSTALIFQPLSSMVRNHKPVRYLINPLNSVYALGAVAARPFRQGDGQVLPIGEDARLGLSYTHQPRPPLLVLVLGETGRSGNFGLNGYGRPTTPELARERVASLRNAWSCGTSTAQSVPCMFSHLGRDGYEGSRQRYETLVDVLQRAGLGVLWLDNQSGCKGVCDRVPHASTADAPDPRWCHGGECLDGVMLEGLDARIAALPPERRARGVVVVLHQMGSHGPAYSHRSPPDYKRFQPECTSVELQACTQAELVNAYDNSIAYTDHFLASTIGWLRERAHDWDGAMVYVADHGESLGEGNVYLHGLPRAIAPSEQMHVPWITWVSDGFSRRGGLAMDCLARKTEARVTHDAYFHSVLGLMDVRTGIYRREMDLYTGCAASPGPGHGPAGTAAAADGLQWRNGYRKQLPGA